MTEQNSQISPSINKPREFTNNTMDFPAAMGAVIAGDKVTKLEWDNPEIVVWLETNLRIKIADGTSHDLIVSDGDMIGMDWVTV